MYNPYLYGSYPQRLPNSSAKGAMILASVQLFLHVSHFFFFNSNFKSSESSQHNSKLMDPKGNSLQIVLSVLDVS